MVTARTLRLAISAVALLGLVVPAPAGLLGTDDEKRIGRQVANQLEKKHGLHREGHLTRRVRDIGRPIGELAKADRPKIDYEFNVLASDEVNAVACPGGWIYAFRGLARKMEADEELAAVLAHEAAHVSERHGMQAVERSLGWQLALGIITGGKGSDLGNVALGLIMNGYSRGQEAEADRIGQIYLFKAGYDIGAMARMLRTLHEATGGGSSMPSFLRTHPADKNRIRAAERREAEILLDLGSQRPATNPPRYAVVYLRDGGEDPDTGEVGEDLAETVGAMLNGSAQARANVIQARTVGEREQVGELAQIASDHSADAAVGLRFTEPPLREDGSGRAGRTTICLSIDMALVPARRAEPELSHTIRTKSETRGSGERKKIEKALKTKVEDAAQQVAIAILRPQAADETDDETAATE